MSSANPYKPSPSMYDNPSVAPGKSLSSGSVALYDGGASRFKGRVRNRVIPVQGMRYRSPSPSASGKRSSSRSSSPSRKSSCKSKSSAAKSSASKSSAAKSTASKSTASKSTASKSTVSKSAASKKKKDNKKDNKNFARASPDNNPCHERKMYVGPRGGVYCVISGKKQYLNMNK